MSLDPLRNPKDPLHKSGPEGERELFRKRGAACDGLPMELAAGAAANIIVNALRQQHATRREAEAAIDELMGRIKALLLDQHYDGMGRRRNLFPFHQVVQITPDAIRHFAKA